MGARTALLIGATGLVGAEVLRLLTADSGWSKVIVLARKVADVVPAKVEWRLSNFDDPKAFEIGQADDIFCCLGTTIKQAGSKEAFRKVDYDYALLLAHAGLKAGASRFLVITALGANAKSMVFYNQVKGELEQSLIALGYPRLVILRPSMLLGHRQQSRPGEQVAVAALTLLGPIFAKPLKKLWGIEATAVARAMLELARLDQPNLEIVENDRLIDLGSRGGS